MIINLRLDDTTFRDSGEKKNSKDGGGISLLTGGFFGEMNTKIPNLKTEKAKTICLEITFAKKSGATYSLTDLHFSKTAFFFRKLQ